jgi:hypothetical protein
MNPIEKKVGQLKNLTQYKNLSEEDLLKAAEKKVAEEQLEAELLMVVNPDELDSAKKLYIDYTAEYSIETSADKSTLYDLIYFEILNFRIKKYLNENQTGKDGASPIIHTNTIETLQKNTEKITLLKSQLGMTKKDADRDNADVVKILENLKQRFHRWINQPDNRANFSLKCPHCLNLFLIRRRLDKEKDEVIQHPWYIKGGLLFNQAIFEDLRDHVITIKQAARYFNTSEDYILWIQKKYPIEVNHIDNNE